jgi:hypothetical protein
VGHPAWVASNGALFCNRGAPLRSKELAIRTALGGGRLRLLSERLTESFLLSSAGGALERAKKLLGTWLQIIMVADETSSLLT